MILVTFFDKDLCQPANISNMLDRHFCAEDLILIPETSSSLQKCTNKLQIYCKKNRLSLNNKNAKVMIVEKRQPKTVPTNFTFTQ